MSKVTHHATRWNRSGPKRKTLKTNKKGFGFFASDFKTIRQLRRAIARGYQPAPVTRLAKLRHRRGARGHETQGFAQ